MRSGRPSGAGDRRNQQRRPALSAAWGHHPFQACSRRSGSWSSGPLPHWRSSNRPRRLQRRRRRLPCRRRSPSMAIRKRRCPRTRRRKLRLPRTW